MLVFAVVLLAASCESGTFHGGLVESNLTQKETQDKPDARGESSGENQNDGSTKENPIDPEPETCGGKEIPIELVVRPPPDVLLIVDRSESMSVPLGGSIFTPPPEPWVTKWDIMRDALIDVTTAFSADVHWGLHLFPQEWSCGAGTMVIPMGPDTADDIASVLLGTGPMVMGFTPMDAALSVVLTTLTSLPAATRYAILATDGFPWCESDGTTGFDRNGSTLTYMGALAAAGIATFVIGFGSDFSSDPAFLGALAAAGGTGSSFTADSADTLMSALETIAGGLLPPPCSFTLATAPPDPDLVSVTFDGDEVPRDPSSTEGWNFDEDPTTITFFGFYCDFLQSGEVGEVQVVYGCPSKIID